MTPPNKASDSRTYDLFAHWASGCYRYGGWVLILTLILALASGIYVWRDLGMNTDTTDMLSEDLPFRVNLKHYHATFPQDVDTMLVVLEGPTPEQTQVAAKHLAARLKQDTFNFQDVDAPGVDDFFARNALLYVSVPELEGLTDRLAAAQPLIAHIAQDPNLQVFLDVISGGVDELRTGRSMELRPVLGAVSATLDARLSGSPRELSWQSLFQGEPQKQKYREFIQIKPRLDYSQLFPAEQSISALRTAAKAVGITEISPVRLRITGEIALANDELNASLRGMEVAGVITFVLVGAVLYFAMRSGGLILNVLICLTLGLILTAAFATAVVGHLNLISIAFAVLYIGLGADFAIHFLLRYRETVENGAPPPEAMRISGGEAGAALTACTITNAIGFYAFMPTDYKGVAELGIISGTGMIISLLVTLTVGPALLRYLPRRLPARPVERKTPIGRVLELSLKWHKRTYAITLAAAIAAVALLPQVTFDYNLLNLQDQKGEAIRTFRELLAETDQSPWHAVALAKNRMEVQALAQQLAQLPEVSQVVNLLDFVPKEQDEKLPLIEEMSLTMGPISISAAKQTTDDQATGKQLSSLYKLAAALDQFIAERPDHPASPAAHGLRSSLRRLLVNLDSAHPNEKRNLLQGVEDDLLATLPIALRNLQIATEAAPFDEEGLPESFRLRWRSLAGEYRLAIYPAQDLNDNDALRRYVHAVQRVVPSATGAPMVSLEAGEAVVHAFGQAFILALAGIIVALLILLRSVKYTVLVLIPLLLSSLFTSAFTVLLNVPFNFVNIIALPLLLGLGIDSSLHMVHRSLNNEVVSEVLIHTSTARAIFYSALTALVDFASLMLSSHQGTASMGILLTVALAFTLICTLVILPTLLKAPTRVATI